MRLSIYVVEVLLVLASTGIITAAESSSEKVVSWGNSAGGAQCGLALGAPIAQGRRPVITIILKSNGPRFKIREATMQDLTSGFRVEDESGKPIDAVINMSAGSEIYVVGVGTPTSAISPGHTMSQDYEVIFRYPQSGSFKIFFRGLVQPIGASEPLYLKCGPIRFTRPL